MPIIPSVNNRLLLRALHDEMQAKKYLKAEIRQPESTTSSGIDSNTSEESEKDKKSQMPAYGADLSTTKHAWAVSQPSSCSESCNEDHSNRSSEASATDFDIYTSANEPESDCGNQQSIQVQRKMRNVCTSLPQQKDSTHPSTTQKKKVELSECDKRQIREGYERFVVNGERPPTGTAFGARLSASNKANGISAQESSDEILFPLERAAAGKVEELPLKEAKRLEKIAKRKTKVEKQMIANAKQSVSEAKLNEFEAKLRARQARIDERHAKLCRRRAIIKEAEDRLQLLESQLDDEEECHRDRERRVKNRERRVRQEEAGIQIKEASLKKRENQITEDLKDIELRKKLVEEKESVSLTMQEIMTKRENLHREQQEKKNRSNFLSAGTISRLLHKSASKKPDYPTTLRQKGRLTSESHTSRSDDVTPSSSNPVPTPRKFLKTSVPESRKGKKNRSTSLDSILDVESSPRYTRNAKADKLSVGSHPKAQNQTSIMGLWL